MQAWRCRLYSRLKIQCLSSISSRMFGSNAEELTQSERAHLEQELPPRELLSELRNADSNNTDPESAVPGDSFGIMRNRVTFYRPVARAAYLGSLGDLMPSSLHPTLCYNAGTIQHLQSRFNASSRDILCALQQSEGDINSAIRNLESRHGSPMQFGAYGVVCLESYVPEAFCLVSYSLADYNATRDSDTLDAIHELTLSAAELPLDTPRRDLVDKFLSDWTVEDGTLCRDVLDMFGLTVNQILLLPHGDYSVQGFHILHPIDKDIAPNIGTGAAACCLDLRTGIHKRFRFHVERIADTISEHITQEMVHYNQGVHILRQPYWFHPDYSVEEYIRFKESLLQPSASIFELRYAFLFAPMHNLSAHCNVVELEKLKVAQHKYEKHYEDFTAPGKWVTSDGANLQTVAAAGGGSNVPGGAMHYHANDEHTIKQAMETRTGPLRKVLSDSMQKHGDRVFNRFYRNNYF